MFPKMVQWLHRCAVIVTAVGALLPALLWIVLADIEVQPTSTKYMWGLVPAEGLQLADVAVPVGTWLWVAVVLLAAAIALILASRTFEEREQHVVAWAAVLIAVPVSLQIFVRGYLLQPVLVNDYLLLGLDLVSVYSFVLSTWLFVRFFRAFPVVLTWERMESAYRSSVARHESRINPRLSDGTTAARVSWQCQKVIVHPAYLVFVLGVTGYALFGFHTSSDEIRFEEFMLMFLAITLFVLMPFSFVPDVILYQHEGAEASDKPKLRWFYLGMLASTTIAVLMLPLGFLEDWLAQDYDCVLDCPTLVPGTGIFSFCGGLMLLVFLLSLLFSMFFSGIIEPSLVLGRGAFFGVLMLGFYVGFVLIEQLLQSELFNRLNVDEDLAGIISALLMAACYGRIEKVVNGPLSAYFDRKFDLPVDQA